MTIPVGAFLKTLLDYYERALIENAAWKEAVFSLAGERNPRLVEEAKDRLIVDAAFREPILDRLSALRSEVYAAIQEDKGIRMLLVSAPNEKIN
jgi:hypothetical protein